MIDLLSRYSLVQDRLAAAARRAGRAPEEAKLIAVSKGRALAEIYALRELGQKDFGENRSEEGSDKISAARRAQMPLTWHMIGHIQRRKARDVAADFDWVHSLDGGPLAERLSRSAAEAGRVLPVLLECNVSGEESKSGLASSRVGDDPAQWADLCAVVDGILGQSNLRVSGLMTMAPVVPDPEQARPVFRRLRQLRDRLAATFPSAALTELSMGMTDDFEIAIEEGATLVRIGRAIFAPAAET